MMSISYDSETSSTQDPSIGYKNMGESDSEDEENKSTTSGNGIKEVDELKLLTKELLNVNWRVEQNKKLLHKMLELEEPSISPKMVDFLLIEGTCEILLGFITQIGNKRRPYPHESDSIDLRYSYRATMLLSVDEPADALLSFLSRRASIIARAMLEVFRDDSAGSFYHSARVLESLLRMFPAEVYDGLTSDGLAEERTARLLRYIGYPPVGDLVVILVALTPIARSSQMYTASTSNRWKYFEAISKWLFLLKLTEIVVNPTQFCRLDEYVTPEQHCSSAAQTLQELIEKLSIEEIGEIVLQPLGYTQSLIDSLVDCALCSSLNEVIQDYETYLTSRRVSLRILSFLLKKSINSENVCFVNGPANTPIATLVPNRLYPLRPLMIQTLLGRLKDIEKAIIQTAHSNGKGATEGDEENGGEGGSEGSSSLVRHPGHQCQRPFTSHRSQLIELFVLILEGSTEMSIGEISVELWKLLIEWNFEYVHNNIYHSMFYRLLFAMLRQNNEKTLKTIFKSAKLLRHFIDAFDCEDPEIAAKLKNSNDSASNKLTSSEKRAIRGFVMNSCNAIRLQTSSLPPSSFLRTFLNSHDRWNLILPLLRAATVKQQPSGLGFYIPSAEAGGRSLSQLASLLSSSRESVLENTIDHGSPYAKSLGFDVETEWPVDAIDDGPLLKPKRSKKKVHSSNGGQLNDGEGNGLEGSHDENEEGRESCSSSDDGSL